MLNKVCLQGRLVADPELRYTQSQTAVCSFRVASDRDYAGSDGNREADFISCVAWKGSAEFINKYFRKGDMILLSGRLQSRSYDGNDGKKVYVTELVVESTNFCASKKDSGSGSSGSSGNSGYGNVQPVAASADDFQALPDDGDLPF